MKYNPLKFISNLSLGIIDRESLIEKNKQLEKENSNLKESLNQHRIHINKIQEDLDVCLKFYSKINEYVIHLEKANSILKLTFFITPLIVLMIVNFFIIK